MQFRQFRFVLLLIALSMAAEHGDAKREGGPVTACTAPEHRQFDFWAGNWDVFDVGNPTQVARVRVEKILGGCALSEDYQGTDGLHGLSYSIFDATRKIWHQTWVTNRGQLISIEGELRNGEMTLSGALRSGAQAERQIRGTWKKSDEGVRETAVTSSDNGKTWQPLFDLIFRPHKP
jgi:hypothetical protein